MNENKELEVSTEVTDDSLKPENVDKKKTVKRTAKTTVKKTALEIDNNDNSMSIIESLRKKPIINAEPEVEQVDENIDDEKNKKLKKGKKEEEIEEVKVTRYLETPVLEGLSDDIVKERFDEGLVNSKDDDRGKTIFQIIMTNVFTFFNMLFFGIAAALIIVGSYQNLLFLATVIPNLIIGIIQEIKAKKQMEKLSLLSSPTTTVIRNSQKVEIPVNEIVLDDIVFYTTGNQISSDSVVIQGSVEVNESLLTGESDAILKGSGTVLFSGSYVVSGACVARVDKIGKDSYIEKLSSNAKKYQKPKSELLRSLNAIIKIISVIIVPLGILTYLNNKEILMAKELDNASIEAFIKTAGSVIAMIPAGLFLLTSMALAVGVVRLSKNNTLVQELYCIEMLARVNVLCLDKTGTITDGTMRVIDSIEIKNPTNYTVREIVGSMMNAFEETNPTSEALIKYFDKNTILKPIDTVPFSSKRKYSAVNFENVGSFLIGAPEFVLTDQYEKVKEKVERLSAEGSRVLALAFVNNKIKQEDVPRNAKCIALIVIQDHIREDASDTIAYFKQNGVDVKVISGDNPITVSEIALRAGVENADRFISLDGLTDDEVKAIAFDYTVFGRVSPEQKRILVKTFKEHKKTVAMTGDGVNDILALKEADCSIAMASGSEATRYISHLVLTDSNFSSMPKVVGEGRRVINNIQRTSTLFLVKTIFAVLLSVMYLAIKHPYPFSPNQLTLIEWFAIGVPAFFLALQPNREQVKGKFIVNVLKTTIPGALTVVIAHLLLTQIRGFVGFEALEDESIYTTVAIYVTTSIMFLVLFDVCRPFNWLRKTIYILMLSACLITILFFSEKMGLNLQNLGLVELLLTIIFILSSYPVMWGISTIMKKLKIVPN